MRCDVTVISSSSVDSEFIVPAEFEYPSVASACPACADEQAIPIIRVPAIALRAADNFMRLV